MSEQRPQWFAQLALCDVSNDACIWFNPLFQLSHVVNSSFLLLAPSMEPSLSRARLTVTWEVRSTAGDDDRDLD